MIKKLTLAAAITVMLALSAFAQTSRPPSWAVGTFYSRDGISMSISNNGQVSVVNNGQTYYGRYYKNRIYLNGDQSTLSRSGDGISTYNQNQRVSTLYSRTNGGWNGGNNGGNNGGGWNGGNNGGNNGGGWNGGWHGSGSVSSPPSWARGTFIANDSDITMIVADNGQITVLNGGQTYYGRYYRGKIYLNGDESTFERNGNGITTYNQNQGIRTKYKRK